MGAFALKTEIHGDVVAVTQTRMRKRITIRHEVSTNGQDTYVQDVTYEPLVKSLVAVPLADVSDTHKLTCAFKAAGVPVSTYDDIRDVLLNLPHMKGQPS